MQKKPTTALWHSNSVSWNKSTMQEKREIITTKGLKFNPKSNSSFSDTPTNITTDANIPKSVLFKAKEHKK
jgi:hypothetical protein